MEKRPADEGARIQTIMNNINEGRKRVADTRSHAIGRRLKDSCMAPRVPGRTERASGTAGSVEPRFKHLRVPGGDQGRSARPSKNSGSGPRLEPDRVVHPGGAVGAQCPVPDSAGPPRSDAPTDGGTRL